MPQIELKLRTRQITYLELIADRDETTLSEAFAQIIETHQHIAADDTSRGRQGRKHIAIADAHLSALDQIAIRWGLNRSDVARRLIDLAADASG